MKNKNSDWTDLLSEKLGIDVTGGKIPEGAKNIPEIAKEWGVADNTARRHTKTLLEQGLIEKHIVKSGNHKRAYFTIKK